MDPSQTQVLADWATTVATLIGGLAVVFAAWQLFFAQKSAQTNFEDQLFREYREIVRELISSGISIDYLLSAEAGEPDSAKVEGVLGVLYRYFDLSNQQAQLAEKRRISPQTWKDWKEGIKFNLNLPLFHIGYKMLRTKLGDGGFLDRELSSDRTFVDLHRIWLEARREKQQHSSPIL